MRNFKKILVIIFIATSTFAFADPSTITPEFIELLKKNHQERMNGTNNPPKFFYSVKSIADKGDPAAQFLYGMVLLNDEPTISKKYLLTSAASGCVGAETLLAVLYKIEKKEEESENLFMSAAKKGDTSAQIAIGGLYQRGGSGFIKSAVTAYAWFKLAHRQSFSYGELASIEDGMSELNLTDAELKKANTEYESLSKEIKKRSYYFCGQANIDASKADDVEPYLKM